MFIMELAGVRVGVKHRYAFIERQCREYTVEGEDAAFWVEVSDRALEEEFSLGNASREVCESVCLYREICEAIAAYNVFLMHSSVLEVDGRAYAFAAKSGVGKSTHTRLWLEHIPGAKIVNGDKPLFRLESDGSITAFGTPWNGKENWGRRTQAPLAAICFLERGAENSIRPAKTGEVFSRLVNQLYLQGERGSVEKRLFLMDALMRAVPAYVLACNISPEAAHVAYETLSRA